MNQRTKGLALNDGVREFNHEIQNFYLPKGNEHILTTNLSELRYYLEEMYQIDMLHPLEKEIYERYQLTGTITYAESLYIKSNIHTYYEFKF
ncbi:hypothetical protein [Metasolibacillus meyeri]|uniref:hypothetical protein n=1 Tax=Metasolibacillus meyeri TaxID=1071052 RepID=UPI000D31F290|nr:hypothetical protein [Metasolibacillus meyeri]